MRRLAVMVLIVTLVGCATVRSHPRPATVAIATVAVSAMVGVPLMTDCYECDTSDHARPFGYGALAGAALGTVVAFELQPDDL